MQRAEAADVRNVSMNKTKPTWKSKYRRGALISVGVYLGLWVLTATWGSWDVDRAFDQEFAFGYRADGDELARISHTAAFNGPPFLV